MGLTLEFYIGNAGKIEEAIADVLLELLDDPTIVHKRADLSLHIDPNDLNLLSVQFGLHSGRPFLELRPFLTVLVDEEDRGLLSVDATWVDYVSNVQEKSIATIVRDWFESMRKEHSDEDIPDPSQDVLDAVRDLITLCKDGKKRNLQVLHGWFL